MIKGERRHRKEFTFVERRKGTFWMYGTIVLSLLLIVWLGWLLK